MFNGLVVGGITATQNVINRNNGYVNIIVDGLFGGFIEGAKLLNPSKIFDYIPIIKDLFFNRK